MANRHVPVRPDLEQLRHQAKDLLHAIRAAIQTPLSISESITPNQLIPQRFGLPMRITCLRVVMAFPIGPASSLHAA
jgi:type VI protein secretion system component VasF